MKIILVAIALGLFSGCTSVNVRPVPVGQSIKTVYIQQNPKVAVVDFLDVLVEGFARHGISAKVVPIVTADMKGAYIVNYVAYRKWDLAPYLVDATIRIEKDGEIIATAEYHLVGGGGFSPMKWEGTKTKIDPVIDELLKDINK